LDPDAVWGGEFGALDGAVIVEGEGAVLEVNLGRPIVTNGAFATRLFSNYSEDLLTIQQLNTQFK